MSAWRKYKSEPDMIGYVFVHVVAADFDAPSDWTPCGDYDDYYKAARSAQRQEKRINGYYRKQ